MIIKVCGMRNAENIQQVSQIEGIDWMGFIFTDKSKRYVHANPDFDTCTNKKKVGVFVNESIDEIIKKIEKYKLDILQLHGDESVQFINDLKLTIENARGGTSFGGWEAARRGIALMKAFPVDSNFDFEVTKPYEDVVDYFLFDAKGEEAGGNGIQFDWSVLDRYDGTTPFLLAGGINPDSVDKIKSFNHPKWIGIDVNSGFEVEPGLKSYRSLDNFLEMLFNDNSIGSTKDIRLDEYVSDPETNLLVPVKRDDDGNLLAYTILRKREYDRYLGYHMILNDLHMAFNYFNYYLKEKSGETAAAFLYSGVMLFMKAFTSAEGRKVKLESNDVFRGAESSIVESFESLKKLRNEFLAHSGSKQFEEVAVVIYYKPSTIYTGFEGVGLASKYLTKQDMQISKYIEVVKYASGKCTQKLSKAFSKISLEEKDIADLFFQKLVRIDEENIKYMPTRIISFEE